MKKILFIAMLSSILAKASNAEKTPCPANCQAEATKYVCGDDNVTYRNQCELKKARCDGKNVKRRHRGHCGDIQDEDLMFDDDDEQNCEQQRLKALKTSNETGIPVFVPVCQPDGSYVQVQCFYGTGYCWCVNDEGKPVPGSSIKYERPKCRRRRVKTKRKRSRNRKQKSTNKKAKKNKACIQADRSEFNTQVANLIMTEFREKHGNKVPQGTLNYKQEMMEWKFDQMDVDKDGILKRREFREFRKVVKGLSRNKVCARHFWQYCDMQSDDTVTKSEWKTCLGLDSSIPFAAFMSLHSEEEQSKRKRKKKQGFSSLSKQDPRGKLSDSPASSPEMTVETAAAMLATATTTGSDCQSAHQQAIEESVRGAISNAFIPQCDERGDYRPVQCHKDSVWCWCVDTKTGAHIAGTSTQDGRPNCDLFKGLASNYHHYQQPSTLHQSEWKKCPPQAKELFQKNLMAYLTFVMNKNTQVQSNQDEASVAQWHFDKMDSDRNGLLSRKELRPLRRKLATLKDLKRCGKRIQFHCDPDGNESISQPEWMACTLKDYKPPPPPALQKQLPAINVNNRKGPNPLEKWLKAD